jgi:hypothetical protein
MLTFTLDTSCVLAAVNNETAGHYVEQLVEFARAGEIAIAITSGFEVDQRRASDEQRRANLEYLSRAQVLQVPGPFRFEMSTFDGPDVLADDNIAQVAKAISAIVLPRGRMPETPASRCRMSTT